MSICWESAKREAKPAAFGLLCSLPWWALVGWEWLKGILR
jgi:hypothetical protein